MKSIYTKSISTKRVGLLVLLGLFGIVGCTFNLDLGTDSLFAEGSAFVVSGTTDVATVEGTTCNVWIGENGVIYHLFQSPQVDNGEFDEITTPGVTSRLLIATRSDLVVDCQIGTIVDVEDVLEIVP
ncbi:MAG: hypothetical protein DHS20C16_35930 [Phycisphaerae bacterium]|nr:MAG: hypothetical protein DHS20C16_35930 [Phycisphaerae bacterium]